MVRPVPIPNTAVKRSVADGSGFIDSARVGSRHSFKLAETQVSAFYNLAATYSRGSYTTTTIGKAAFDGRVRNGIGSVHSFMTTKVSLQTATVFAVASQLSSRTRPTLKSF